MIKLTLLFACFMASLNLSFAQSKKNIKKYKIKSITETVTTFEGGKELTRNDQFTRYDKNGQIIEQIDYDKNGKIKTKTITKYNNLEDKNEETIFDGNNKQVLREVYKYDADGEKSEEWHYDDKDELVSKSIYTVKNGLKIERKMYDTKGKLIQTKKYAYQ